jgi:sulfonate transport system permease protein
MALAFPLRTLAAPEGGRASTAPLVDARPGGRPRSRARLPRPVRRAIGPLAVVLLWQALSAAGVIGERTMAPPTEVLRAGADLLATGELQHHLLTSLRRVLQGLAIGVTVGVGLATVAGMTRRGEDLVDSTVQALRSVPVLGLIPLMIIWFGIGESTKIAIVALATTFPVYINTYAGIRGVDAKLVETGSTFGLSRVGLIRHVVLPGSVPGFLVGLRYALTTSWLVMLVAEQINARSGLGFLVNEARSWYRTDIIVLALVLYGVLGLVADGIVRLLERAFLSWRRGFEGA